MSFLMTVSFCFRDRHAGGDALKRINDFVELVRLNNALDQFHRSTPEKYKCHKYEQRDEDEARIHHVSPK